MLEEHSWWKEFGCPFDARSVLSKVEYQAHLALMEGEAKYKKREAKRQKSKMKRK